MNRSHWICPLLILITSSGLIGCSQLEQALAPDPNAERWSGESPQTKTPQVRQPSNLGSPTNQSDEPLTAGTPQRFADIETAPENLQVYIQDLAQLEVLNPRGETAEGEPLFAPNQPIKRSTFVRWMVETNNRINRDRPTRQFRLASPESSDPVYTDVPRSHPDFPYIQGLAEAGYLPSTLTGDDTDKTFQPETALNRETLLQWKVPIDQQKPLPTVTVAKVKELWGFKDAEKVTPRAASAIVADYANDELSNIRRLIGASLLLQPQKAVSRAEATAALWYFGTDGKGYSAKDILRAEVQSAASENTDLSNEIPIVPDTEIDNPEDQPLNNRSEPPDNPGNSASPRSSTTSPRN